MIEVQNGLPVDIIEGQTITLTNAELLLQQRITNQRVIALTAALAEKTAEKTAIDSAVQTLGINT